MSHKKKKKNLFSIVIVCIFPFFPKPINKQDINDDIKKNVGDKTCKVGWGWGGGRWYLYDNF